MPAAGREEVLFPQSGTKEIKGSADKVCVVLSTGTTRSGPLNTLSIFFALALILPVTLAAQTSSLDGTHLYSPATNLEQSELQMLGSAKRSVDIAMYSFTDRELAAELVELARSGVKIRVYRDRTEYQHEIERSDLNTTAMLIAAGIEVRIKGQKDLMHLNYVASQNMWCTAPDQA